MKTAIAILLSGALMIATGSASAEIFDLVASIDGSQAGTPSTATGSATMTLDDATNLFSWNITWSPLMGTITAAHFHGPALPGQNAGVQVNWGSISGLTSPSLGSTTISNEQAGQLLAGLWYINIHSDLFPGGEIRGQVELAVAVEAATWGEIKTLYE